MSYLTRKILIAIAVTGCIISIGAPAQAGIGRHLSKIVDEVSFCDFRDEICKKEENGKKLVLGWAIGLSGAGFWVLRKFGLLAFLFFQKPQPREPLTSLPKNQNAKWEVFRDGKVAGPYSKEELRFQQVVGRTNVRRAGEKTWTRADKIPELAEFLAVKP